MTVRGALEDYGYNRYPDEKGTERPLQMTAHTISSIPVTTVTPMKRGLKVTKGEQGGDFDSYNRDPDEKGTERPYTTRHYETLKLCLG